MRFAFIALLFCMPWAAQAQLGADTTRNADSTAGIVYNKLERDTIDWRPRSMRLSVDLAGPARLVLNDSAVYLEAAADIQFDNYHLVVEGGYANVEHGLPESPVYQQFYYAMNGVFGRVGVDVNLLGNSEKFGTNGAFFGVRYGQALFNDYLYFPPENNDLGWPVNSNGYEYTNTNASARWWEAVGSLRTQVWSGLHVGYSVRYRFGYQVISDVDHEPYAIPGMGRVNAIPWFVNAHVSWVLPFSR